MEATGKHVAIWTLHISQAMLSYDELASRLRLAAVAIGAAAPALLSVPSCAQQDRSHCRVDSDHSPRRAGSECASSGVVARARCPTGGVVLVHNDVPYTRRFLIDAFERYGDSWRVVTRAEDGSNAAELETAHLDVQVVQPCCQNPGVGTRVTVLLPRCATG